MTITPAINDSSARGGGNAFPADVLKQIAVFRFCEQVLRDRPTGGSRDWLWQVKGKVASYCRKTLESRIDEGERDEVPPLLPYEDDLSDLERRDILHNHPLLSDLLPGATEQRIPPDWLDSLRSRVARYMASLRESRGRGHDN